MKKWLVATACLTMLGSSLASAQDSTRNQPPKALRQQPATTTNAGTLPEAPIGHRQPTPGNLPPETGKNNPDRVDAQDRELDRMIKGICKGC
jgi:hypothetical protein